MYHRLIIVLLFALCASGAWAVTPSGTLPVMYITTKNNQQITRDNAIDATLYVVGYGDYPALGDADNQIPLTIRGRGNWTWSGFDKKPYKIVFAQGQGQKLLGMHKSKHWALLAGADEYFGFFKNTVGYMLSEQVGLPYTPHQVPVELVLNGSYEGLYFVTETIRIDNDRVNIHEQQDGETDPDLITGGWLIEIDNYWSEGNITFNEDNGQYVMVTPQSPEDLSTVQRDYITEQLSELNASIYNRGNQPLEQILDLTDAARYYLVQEIMEDCESYHGSCYLYKDRDSTANPLTDNSLTVIPKWHFGPVWDFGNAYNRHQERFIYDRPSFSQIWIEQICQHEQFYQLLLKLWYQYRQYGHNKVLDELDTFASTIASAARRDAQRWNGYNARTCDNVANRKQEFLHLMNWRLDWLYSQWGEGDSTPLTDTESVQINTYDKNRQPAHIMILNGQLLIERDGHQYTLTGLKVK